MRVLVHTANLGNFDTVEPPVAQVGVEMDWVCFTDKDFPPRPRAMTRRLQSKIPKMFGWDLRPGYDLYFWHDASLQLHKPDSLRWFLEQLGDHDMAVFKHPWRSSAREEAEFIAMKLHNGSSYIKSRYDGEDLMGQMDAIRAATWYKDEQFYAGGAFCYRPTEASIEAMKEWWIHTSRYHCIDQLAFAFVLAMFNRRVKVIDQDIYHASHILWRGHNH